MTLHMLAATVLDSESQYCPECQKLSPIFTDYVKGDVICKSCGTILVSRILDESPEWKQTSVEDRGYSEYTARCSLTKDDENGFHIVHVGGPEDMRGALLTVAKLQATERETESRYHANVSLLKSICHSLNIASDVQVAALGYFREAVKKSSIKLNTNEAIAAACLYLACRAKSCPRTISEISMVSNEAKDVVGKLFMKLSNEMRIVLSRIAPSQFVPRFTSPLKAPGHVMEKCIDMCDNLSAVGIMDDVTNAITAAAVILAVCIGYDLRDELYRLPEITLISVEAIKRAYVRLRSYIISGNNALVLPAQLPRGFVDNISMVSEASIDDDVFIVGENYLQISRNDWRDSSSGTGSSTKPSNVVADTKFVPRSKGVSRLGVLNSESSKSSHSRSIQLVGSSVEESASQLSGIKRFDTGSCSGWRASKRTKL